MHRFLEALNAEGIPASSGYVPLYKEGFLKDAWQRTAIPKVYDIDLDYTSIRCPETETACYKESIWFTQNMLLGNRQDMDTIVAAITKIRENADELTEGKI